MNEEENKFSKRWDYIKRIYEAELKKDFKNDTEEERFRKIQYGNEIFEEMLCKASNLVRKEEKAKFFFEKYPELLPKKKIFDADFTIAFIVVIIFLLTIIITIIIIK